MNYLIILSCFLTTLLPLSITHTAHSAATPYAAFLKKKSPPAHGTPKEAKYNLKYVSPKAAATNVVEIILAMIEPDETAPVIVDKKPAVDTKKPAKLPYNLNITKIEQPLSLLLTFETKEALTPVIKNARQQFATMAKVLQVAVTLYHHDQLPELSLYLQKNMPSMPAYLVAKSPDQIIAYYISQCYSLLVEENVTGWLNKKPQLFIKHHLQELFTPQNELFTLQVIELLAKFNPLWDFCAKIFFNDEHSTNIQLEYPEATMSIEAWSNITENKALDLYKLTTHGSKEDEEDKKTAANKHKRDMEEFKAHKEHTLQAFKDNTKKLEAKHLEILDHEFKAHAFKMKFEQLEEQKTELELLEVTLTEPELQLVSDSLSTALDACHEMTSENLNQAHQTILSNLMTTYEWLLEPQSIKSVFDDEDTSDDYEAYLHLKEKFNQYKLYPQIKYVLRKLVYTWNAYCFIGYAGKQESMVTLKFSAKNIKRNSISDWLKFTKLAGFSYSGQFEKLDGQPAPKTTLEKLVGAYKWLRLKMKSTPKITSPEQIEEQKDFIKNWKDETQALLDQEAKERAKLFELFKEGKAQIRNPKAKLPAPKAKAPTAPEDASEEPMIVKKQPVEKAKEQPLDFDADFVTALRAARAKKK